MIKRMLTSALIAGFAAGLVAAVLHFAFAQELILLAEEYESGTLVHFQGVAADGAVATEPASGALAAEPAAGAMAAEPSALSRNFWTVLFQGLQFSGLGLLMVAGFALAERFGRPVAARDGILWGIAGFVTFQLAPEMGLAPELPGIPAADLAARQVWWLGTVIATAAALGLLAWGRGIVAAAVAVVLLAAPHVIGAPALDSFGGIVAPEMSAEFAARSLGLAFTAWAVLGWLAARLWTAETT